MVYCGQQFFDCVTVVTYFESHTWLRHGARTCDVNGVVYERLTCSDTLVYTDGHAFVVRELRTMMMVSGPLMSTHLFFP